MGLKKLAAKLAEYNARLEDGKAHKIQPSHVRKVLGKLRRKAQELEAEIAAAQDPGKKDRLEKKLTVARTHIDRADWLLSTLNQ